jgi:hypothetical protein
MNNKEYIEREVALEATTYIPLVEPDPTDIIYLTLVTAQKNIRKIPAADVAPVVHGEWIHHYYDSGEPIDDKWYCAECHMCNDHKRTWYCPYCGAKMDGGNNK